MRVWCAAALMVLVGCSNDDVPTSDASDAINYDRFGRSARSRVIAASDGAVGWVQAATAGWRGIDQGRDVPARAVAVTMRRDCAVRRTLPGEALANVHVRETWGRDSTVWAFDRAAVADRAKQLIESKRQGYDHPQRQGVRGPLSALDVIVTERGKPLNLVLQGGTSILWNLTLAEGARVAHVTVIGPGPAAIANLPEGTTLDFMTGKRAKRCKVVPARRPKPHWDVVADAKKPSGHHLRKGVANLQGAFRRYDGWFRARFGRRASYGAIGMHKVNHVLVGPFPARLDERPAYASLKGATVHVTPTDQLIAATERDYRAQARAMIREAAERALGAPLSSIAPSS